MIDKRTVIIRVTYRNTLAKDLRTIIFTSLIPVEVPFLYKERNRSLMYKVTDNIARIRARKAINSVDYHSIIETSEIETLYVTSDKCTNYNKLPANIKVTF